MQWITKLKIHFVTTANTKENWISAYNSQTNAITKSIVGIVFRLLEEQTGTVRALLIFIILFALLNINAKGATLVSVGATAMQAGFMLPAAYFFSRNLRLPVFLHFGWD